MAKWVELTGPFDYRVPGKRAMVSFQAGYVAYMPDAMATACVETGAGRFTDRPQGARVKKDGTVTYERVG